MKEFGSRPLEDPSQRYTVLAVAKLEAGVRVALDLVRAGRGVDSVTLVAWEVQTRPDS